LRLARQLELPSHISLSSCRRRMSQRRGWVNSLGLMHLLRLFSFQVVEVYECCVYLYHRPCHSPIKAAVLCPLLVFPCAVTMLFHTKTPYCRCRPSHYDPEASQEINNTLPFTPVTPLPSAHPPPSGTSPPPPRTHPPLVRAQPRRPPTSEAPWSTAPSTPRPAPARRCRQAGRRSTGTRRRSSRSWAG
jgi:hypothetical protein